MDQTTKRSYTCILLILLVSSLLGCSKKGKTPEAKFEDVGQERVGLYVKRAGTQDPKKIVVATVDGVDISMAALIREMNRISPRYLRSGDAISSEIDKKIRDYAVNNLIFRELAVREAHRQGMSIDRTRINEIINKIKSGMDTPEAYKKYLESRGVSEEELRQEIERSHLFEMITGREVYASITIDEKMLKEKYEKEKSLLILPGDLSGSSFSHVKSYLERMVKAEQGAERMKQWEKKLRDKAVIHLALAAQQ